MIRRLFLLLLFIGGLGGRANAQKPRTLPPPVRAPQAELRDCIRRVGSDSVVLFYNAAYVLTPAGCATFQRLAHIPDSSGRFHGVVHDYRLANNMLVLTGNYEQGRKQGLFKLYHPNGSLAAQGRYHEGRQVGEWTYWYPSGQWRQVLNFGGGGLPVVQQFQDENQQRLVTDGNGTWHRDEDGLRGRVVNGIPDGLWQLRRLANNERVADEKFVKSHFRFGRVYGSDQFYIDKSRFDLADWEDYSQAKQPVISPPCPPVITAP